MLTSPVLTSNFTGRRPGADCSETPIACIDVAFHAAAKRARTGVSSCTSGGRSVVAVVSPRGEEVHRRIDVAACLDECQTA